MSSCTNTYPGDGTTTVFPFTFTVQSTGDLQVMISDITHSPVAVTILDSTQYSISGLGNPSGGSITYPLSGGSPLPVGWVITLRPVVQMPVGCGSTDAAVAATAASAAAASAAQAEAAAACAAGSATAAAGNAGAAANYAGAAQTSANNAQVSATNAQNSANAAQTSATNAQTYANNAQNSATDAQTDADNAHTYAGDAADSAAAAAASAAAMSGTSATPLAVTTGSQSFTTQTGKYFNPGTWLLIASAANPANYLYGQVTAYAGTTLTVNVTDTGGSGTHADWAITVSGTQGPQGAQGAPGATGPKGDQGPPGPQGPGSVVSVTAGNGLAGGTITTSGTLSVQAADSSITVTSSGIAVNTGTGAGQVASAAQVVALQQDVAALQQDVIQNYLLDAISGAWAIGQYSNGGYDAFNSDTLRDVSGTSGQAYDASNKLYSSSNSGTVTFATAGSGNWTVPAGITSIQIEAWGAGGGGGGYMGTGGNGGTTTVGPLTATGGSGGTYTGSGGAGGAASGGDVNTTGTTGSARSSGTIGGAGGSGANGGAGGAGGTSSNNQGGTGTGPGGGGGGRGDNINNAGAGGGGGGYARKNSYSVTPGNQIAYTVGAGGARTESADGLGADGQVKITYTPLNMTLVGAALNPAPSAPPAKAQITILWKDLSGSAALNTDFTVEVTGNGGTNWVLGTLADTGIIIAGFHVLTATVALSGSGTTVQYRLKTLNGKSQQVKAVGLTVQ